jgi:DNA-binding LytR/AlgR family response regulator
MYAYRDIRCYAYIEKPFKKEEVREIIRTAIQFETEKDDDRNLFIRKKGILYPVAIKEIIFIESENHELTIHTSKDSVSIANISCKDILKQLDSKRFIQCSRSVIVNREYIKNIDPTNQFMELDMCKESIEIGTVYKKNVLGQLGL